MTGPQSAPGDKQPGSDASGRAQLEEALLALVGAGRRLSAVRERIDEVMPARARAITETIQEAGPAMGKLTHAVEYLVIDADLRFDLHMDTAGGAIESAIANLMALRLQGYQHLPTYEHSISFPDEHPASDHLEPALASALWGELDAAQEAALSVSKARLVHRTKRSWFPTAVLADVLGRTDGIPTQVRDRGNRQRLDDELGTLEQRLKFDHGKALRERYEALAALKQRLAASQLFLLDLDLERGSAIVARDNPDFATHVVTIVPGAHSGITTAPMHIDVLQVVQNEMTRISPSASPSVIGYLWLAPNATRSLFKSTLDDDADALRRFTDGLVATCRGTPPRRTLISLGYGGSLAATACAKAKSDQAVVPVDAVAFFGPTNVGLDHVSDMGLPDGARVYAGTAANGSSRLMSSWLRSGRPPTSKKFGADVFDASTGTTPSIGDSAPAHPNFGNPDSPATQNAARIALGLEPITLP